MLTLALDSFSIETNGNAVLTGKYPLRVNVVERTKYPAAAIDKKLNLM